MDFYSYISAKIVFIAISKFECKIAELVNFPWNKVCPEVLEHKVRWSSIMSEKAVQPKQ